jgi:hypothetical protein
MGDEVTAALIAAIVSGFASIITYLIATNKIRAERDAMERELQRKLTDRLYDLRLQHYPGAFVITDQLGKHHSAPVEQRPAFYADLVQQLRQWKKGEPSFLMSDKSLQAYRQLLEALKANPALGNRYNEQQMDRIWRKRVAFRDALRDDVGLLFVEENNDDG